MAQTSSFSFLGAPPPPLLADIGATAERIFPLDTASKDVYGDDYNEAAVRKITSTNDKVNTLTLIVTFDDERGGNQWASDRCAHWGRYRLRHRETQS